jgi:hypothetical protein
MPEAIKTYGQFKARVKAMGLTLEQLRCDVRPTQEILDLMEEVGPDRYERLVLRFEKEAGK